MKKTINILIVTLSVILISACTKQHKIGYIQMQKVFNDFDYKKQLETEFSAIRDNRKFVLDSMTLQLKTLNAKLMGDKENKDLQRQFVESRELYMQRKSMIEEEEAGIAKQFDEKILNQLNAYVKKFGEENKFAIIYGANATGNIMYGDSTLDVTKEVVEYINKKFKGK